MPKDEYSWGPTPVAQTGYLTSKITSFLVAQAADQRAKDAKQPGSEKALKGFWKGIRTEMDYVWPTFAAEEEAEAKAVEEAEIKKAAEAAAALEKPGGRSKGKKKHAKAKKAIQKEAQAPREPPPSTMTPEAWRAHRHEKVVRWFYNKTSKSRKSAPKIQIIVTPTLGKTPCDYQMYSRMYYVERIKEAVDCAIATKAEAGEQFAPVAVRQEITKQLWDKEDAVTREEVLAELEAFIESREKAAEELVHALDDDLKAERTPEEYHNFLEILPDVLHAFFSVISAKSGWTFSVLAGGPDPANPKEKGGIRTLSFHAGRSEQDQNFAQFLGAKWRDDFMRPFSGWAHMLFPKETRSARALSESGTSNLDMLLAMNPDFIDEDRPADTPPLPPAPNPERQTVIAVPGKETSPVASADANAGTSAKTSPMSGKGKKGGRKKKPAGKNKAEEKEVETTGDRSGGRLKESNGENTGSNVEGGKELNKAASGSVDETAIPKFPEKPLAAWEEAHDLLLDEGLVQDEFESQPDTLEDPAIEDIGTLLLNDDARQVTYDPSTSAPAPGSLAHAAISAGLVNSGDGADIDAMMNRVEDSFSGNESSRRIDTVGQAGGEMSQVAMRHGEGEERTKRTREAEPGDVLQSRAKRACRLHPRLETPTWVEAALQYLKADMEDQWGDCLDAWVKFETVCAILDGGPVRLPGASSRPKILSSFVQKRKWEDVDVGNLNKWAKEWLVWWCGIQPGWRKTEGGGLPNMASGGGDLRLLKKPGPNGLFSVLVGLKWWAKAKKPPVPWKDAVRDLETCFLVLSGLT